MKPRAYILVVITSLLLFTSVLGGSAVFRKQFRMQDLHKFWVWITYRIAVADLETAAEQYRKLGFVVEARPAARERHPQSARQVPGWD